VASRGGGGGETAVAGGFRLRLRLLEGEVTGQPIDEGKCGGGSVGSTSWRQRGVGGLMTWRQWRDGEEGDNPVMALCWAGWLHGLEWHKEKIQKTEWAGWAATKVGTELIGLAR
jgi:hypothetical protein